MIRTPAAVALSVGFAVVFVGACATPNLPPDEAVIDVPDRAVPLGPGDGATTDADQPDTFVPDGGADGEGGVAGLKVFVSSSTAKGNLGGLAGGDALCTSLAKAAGLGGTWAAWLSIHDNGPHAIDRVTSAGPWRLVSGELVAASKTALASGTLQHAIDHDEKGVAVAAGRAWTGTGPDGKYSTNDCERWTPAGGIGRVGATDATGPTWTSLDKDDCGGLRHVFCFQL